VLLVTVDSGHRMSAVARICSCFFLETALCSTNWQIVTKNSITLKSKCKSGLDVWTLREDPPPHTHTPHTHTHVHKTLRGNWKCVIWVETWVSYWLSVNASQVVSLALWLVVGKTQLNPTDVAGPAVLLCSNMCGCVSCVCILGKQACYHWHIPNPLFKLSKQLEAWNKYQWRYK
jgi:hypothetical protein